MLARPRPRPGTRRAARLLAAAGIGLLVAVHPAAPPVYAHDDHGAVAQGGDLELLAQDDEEVVDTEWGPVGPADRDLLVRVKLAGNWEIPAGEMAAEKGSTERVREVGGLIREEHIELDRLTDELAEKLGVSVPAEPMAQHEVYLDRMAEKTGEEFDFEFVQRLREAHGQVYPIIAYARTGTQNDLVREFASAGEEFVNRHMDYLESTGLVDWNLIPPAPGPAGAPTRFLSAEPGGVNPIIIWLMLGAAVIAGSITVVRTVRPR